MGAYPICVMIVVRQLQGADLIAYHGQQLFACARAKGDLVSINIFFRIADLNFKLDMVL